MRSTHLAALAALTTVFAGPVAADPQWTFVQAGYSVGDETSGGDTDAFGIGGSLQFADLWHVQASYGTGEIGGVDHNFWEFVAGAHPAVSDSTDLVIEIGYGTAENDDFNNADLDILRLTAGARSMITDSLEVNGDVTYADGDADSSGDSRDGTNVSARVGGRYLFTEAFSVGVNYTFEDVATGGDLLNLNFRYAFGDVM